MYTHAFCIGYVTFLTDSVLKPLEPHFLSESDNRSNVCSFVFRKCVHSLNLCWLLVNATEYCAHYIFDRRSITFSSCEFIDF